MRFLFLLFIIIPIIEITVLINVGDAIGAWNTVGLVLLSAFIGVNMLRYQGLSTLLRAQQRANQGEIPGQEMVEGIVLAGGGALLRGLDKRLTDKINIPFHIAEDPLRAVARGTGIALKNVDNALDQSQVFSENFSTMNSEMKQIARGTLNEQINLLKENTKLKVLNYPLIFSQLIDHAFEYNTMIGHYHKPIKTTK